MWKSKNKKKIKTSPYTKTTKKRCRVLTSHNKHTATYKAWLVT